jgi:hypothetical protein
MPRARQERAGRACERGAGAAQRGTAKQEQEPRRAWCEDEKRRGGCDRCIWENIALSFFHKLFTLYVVVRGADLWVGRLS